MSKDAARFARAPKEQRRAAWNRFWNDTGGLFKASKASGTPMKP